ncbi:protein aveugle-like [Phaenicophaeus curvirostris]|uniref:protein aveugle-like n=1 Tax=Phaenicophaeus curvirostris TaxID=33595 RepID=UPI0037F0AF4D
MDTPVQNGAEAPPEGCPVAEAPPEGCPAAERALWEQRPAGQWTVAEVGAWLAARSGAEELADLAWEHAVSGRVLLRLTEGSLRRMGVTPRSRRRELLRELLQLRLQQELEELLSIVGE